MSQLLNDIAHAIGAQLVGDGNVEVDRVASLASAGERDLVFIEDATHLPEAQTSRAGAVIAGDFAAAACWKKPLLIVPHPRIAFARAAALLQPAALAASGIDPTAAVDATARLGADVSIGPHSSVAARASIGDRTSIGARVSIGAGVVIGRDCVIYPNVAVYPGTTLGDRVIVHAGAVLGADGFGFVRDDSTGRYEKFPQVGTLRIGDDVEIGANTTIDRGALDATVVGRGTKLDNLVHVGHNVQIGEDVVIAAQTGISGSSVVESSAVIGGQVGIGDHVRICEGAILGAQGGVPSNKVIRGKGIVFWGTPARPIRQYLKELAALARLAKKRGEKEE